MAEQATTRIYTRHGMTGTKLHETWKEMHRRCRGTSKHSMEYYQRGIRVSEEWDSAAAFIAWATDNGYEPGLQLDRIDNDLGYSADNCRWVTPKQNANNRRNNVRLLYAGKYQTLSEIADALGMNYSTLCNRYKRGWKPQRMFNEPVNRTR